MLLVFYAQYLIVLQLNRLEHDSAKRFVTFFYITVFCLSAKIFRGQIS